MADSAVAAVALAAVADTVVVAAAVVDTAGAVAADAATDLRRARLPRRE